MPAFINAHTHIPLLRARPRPPPSPGTTRRTSMRCSTGRGGAIDRRLTIAGTRASADALYIDCIKQGVTTIFDHHASTPRFRGACSPSARAKKFGIRSCLCYGSPDRDGEEEVPAGHQGKCRLHHLLSDAPRPDARGDVRRARALHHQRQGTSERMVEANNGRTGFHIHVSEGMNDVYDSSRTTAAARPARLQDHGILGEKDDPRTLHPRQRCRDGTTDRRDGHDGRQQPGEQHGQRRRHLSGHPAAQARDPARHGHRRLHQRYARSRSRSPLCSQRSQNCLPNVGWCEVTDMLFRNNAKIGEKYFPDTLGVLKPGAAADIIVMDYKPFTPVLRREYRRAHDLRHDGPPVPNHHRRRQAPHARPRARRASTKKPKKRAHPRAGKKLWGDLNHRC